MELHAKLTIFAEGCRGSLTKSLYEQLALTSQCQQMTFAIGLKELWELDPKKHTPGFCYHSVGFPLVFLSVHVALSVGSGPFFDCSSVALQKYDTYGGSFMYQLDEDGQKLCAIGLVIALDYANPYLHPFQELQRFKKHPAIAN
ncbi:MAG: hypothetical protein GY847_30770 [Proteobacteria bacterium]|nr:hypothetical protein [Pseudomonadota bacterium]